jgi:hypothetical protein
MINPAPTAPNPTDRTIAIKGPLMTLINLLEGNFGLFKIAWIGNYRTANAKQQNYEQNVSNHNNYRAGRGRSDDCKSKPACSDFDPVANPLLALAYLSNLPSAE